MDPRLPAVWKRRPAVAQPTTGARLRLMISCSSSGAVGVESSVSEDRRVVDPAAQWPERLGAIGCRVGDGYVRRTSYDTCQACPLSVRVKLIQG